MTRSIGVFEDGQIVGESHSHQLEMSIPGGTSVAGGVSNVEVQPTHTRRSIMTQMLCHQINGIHGRGEPLTALFATESVIYGRFGYGQDQVIARAFEKGADDYIVKLFVNGGGKVDHMGGSIVGLRLSTFRKTVRLSVQQECHFLLGDRIRCRCRQGCR